MPAFAILGATGSTGSNILTILLSQPNSEVRVLVRSRSKLEHQLSGKDIRNLTIYEGTPANAELLRKCTAGTRAVFIALGPPGNMPGCTILQDAVASLIVCLRELREQPPFSSSSPSVRPSPSSEPTLPRIILLSSASTQPELSRQTPRLALAFLWTGVYHIYVDCVEAEKLLRAESGWLRSTYVKPEGLVHDAPLGYVLEKELDETRGQAFTSFADLAAGMVDLGSMDDEEFGARWENDYVSVRAKQGTAKVAWGSAWLLLKGCVVYYFPGLYPWLF